jgi:hypothetical protein
MNTDEGDVLQPHELAEQGLGGMFPPASFPTLPPMEVLDMAIANQPPQGQGADFVPEEDVIETLPDGRQVQKAVKGVPIPYADALKAGLIKAPEAQGPKETKPSAGPLEVKAEEPKPSSPTAPSK